MLAPFRFGVRAFLGPYALLLAEVEGHYHMTDGTAGLFAKRVRTLPFPVGAREGSLRVFVDSLYPARKAPIDFEIDVPPVADEALVNGRRFAIRGASGRPRLSVPPTQGTYALAIEIPGGSARFEFGPSPPSTSCSWRDDEPPPSTGGPRPDAMAAVEPFLQHLRDRRIEDAYALCSEVYRSVVPLREFAAEAATAAGLVESLDDWALTFAGGEPRDHPSTVEVEVFRQLRRSEPVPPSLLDRLLARSPVRTHAERAPIGLRGSLTLGPAGGRLDILALSFRPFAVETPSGPVPHPPGISGA